MEPSYFVFRQIFEEVCPDLRLLRAKNGVEALVTEDLAERPLGSISPRTI